MKCLVEFMQVNIYLHFRSHIGQNEGILYTQCFFLSNFALEYEGVSKSFWTESIMTTTNNKTLIEKEHKGLWWQNSLD